MLILLSLLPLAWLNATDMSYNQSRLNSKWGVIELVLPPEIPPNTFWNPLVKAKPIELNEDIGKIDEGNCRLLVKLKIPHICGLIKYDGAFTLSWIYKNGMPIKCKLHEFGSLIDLMRESNI